SFIHFTSYASMHFFYFFDFPTLPERHWSRYLFDLRQSPSTIADLRPIRRTRIQARRCARYRRLAPLSPAGHRQLPFCVKCEQSDRSSLDKQNWSSSRVCPV